MDWDDDDNKVINFILDGGLCGKLRGFDHKKEKRPYGFKEAEEDAVEIRRLTEESLLTTEEIAKKVMGPASLIKGVLPEGGNDNEQGN